MFLEISRKTQENNFAEVSFSKVSGWWLVTLFKERLRRIFFFLWMLRNFLKALLNLSNISSNITKMSYSMKCWIDLIERENSKKNKEIMLDEEKSGWRRIWLRANFSSNIFRIIQHNNNKKIIHIKLKWAWTAAKKILTIYLNYKNKMGKNTKMYQKKLKIVEKVKKHTKKNIQRKQKKRKVEETCLLSRFSWAWLFSIKVYKL